VITYGIHHRGHDETKTPLRSGGGGGGNACLLDGREVGDEEYRVRYTREKKGVLIYKKNLIRIERKKKKRDLYNLGGGVRTGMKQRTAATTKAQGKKRAKLTSKRGEHEGTCEIKADTRWKDSE